MKIIISSYEFKSHFHLFVTIHIWDLLNSMGDLPKHTIVLKINNKNVNTKPGLTIMQACFNLGIEIPRFCYHEKLSIAGNCRMCLVEVKNSPKLAASCAIPIAQNMTIFTESSSIRKVREGILEFLLSNHPLDCPICDQGGECDLQDQTLLFGSDRGRFYEFKRSVREKNFSPIIKTLMTRCIHCTRCIRFAHEVMGFDSFGVVGRGNSMEISTYMFDNSLKSEVLGNLIDICPVGALTSKPYSFKARPWELRSVESLDIFDSFGSNIRIDLRSQQIMRILPKLNESINNEWITDKIRFSYDSLLSQRLLCPIRRDLGFEVVCWRKESWKNALFIISTALRNYKTRRFYRSLVGIYGKLSSLESLFGFKSFFNLLGSANIFNSENVLISNDFSCNYLVDLNNLQFNSKNSCMLVGIDPRLEVPMLNIKLRKAFVTSKIYVVSIGVNINLNFYVKLISNSTAGFVQILEGNHFVCSKIFRSKNFFVIFGQAFFSSTHNSNFFLCSRNLSKYVQKNFFINSFNFFTNSAAVVNGNALGLNSKYYRKLFYDFHEFNKCYTTKEVPYMKLRSRMYYFLNVDLSSLHLARFFRRDFIIYQGHHGQNIKPSLRIDLFLPTPVFIETNSHYLSSQGILQCSQFANVAPSLVRTDLQIFNILFYFVSGSMLSKSIFFNFKKIKFIISNFLGKKNYNFFLGFYLERVSFLVRINNFSMQSSIKNYYFSDQISKNSKIMAKLMLEVNNNIFKRVKLI